MGTQGTDWRVKFNDALLTNEVDPANEDFGREQFFCSRKITLYRNARNRSEEHPLPVIRRRNNGMEMGISLPLVRV